MKKQTPLLVLALLICIKTFAQDKLKEVQTNSLWAATKIKVDGNIAEWKNDFQAYNKNTKLYYIMANDDKYLYLTIESTDVTNNTKIAAGGITLTINTDNKKKEKDAFVIGFPVVNRVNRGAGQRGQGGPGGFAGAGGAGGGRGGFGGARNGVVQSDSAIKAAAKVAHDQFIETSKEIKVFGFKDITDTLISIYNEYSIKASIGYDAQGNFTYELAVPLKALNLSVTNPKEFSYNLKVNGLQVPTRNDANGGGRNGGDNAGGGRNGGGAAGGGNAGGGNAGGGNAGGGNAGGGNAGGGNAGGGRGGRGGGAGGAVGFAGGGVPGGGRPNPMAEITSPTDFWGKYTLAKN